jgi:hypothetical protein
VGASADHAKLVVEQGQQIALLEVRRRGYGGHIGKGRNYVILYNLMV